MGRRCIIPACALIVISTLFSVAVSAIGGYMYYFVVFNSLRVSAINEGLGAVEEVSVQISASAVESFLQMHSLIYAASLLDLSALSTPAAFSHFLNATFTSHIISLSRGPLSIQGAEVAVLLPRYIAGPADAEAISWITVFYDQLNLLGNTLYTFGSTSDGITFERHHLSLDNPLSPQLQFPAYSVDNTSLDELYRVSGPNETFSTLSPFVALDRSPYFYTTSYAYVPIDSGSLTLEVAVYQTVDVWFGFITNVLASASTQIMVYEPISAFVATTSVEEERERQQRCYGTYDEFLASDRRCLVLPYHDNPSGFIRGIIGAVVDPRWSNQSSATTVPTASSTVTVEGHDYLVITSQLVAIGLLRPVLIWSRLADEVLRPLRNNTIFIVLITAGAVLLSSLIVGLCTVASLMRPMSRIGEKMQQVQSMELSLSGTLVDAKAKPPLLAVKEVDTLQQQFMALSTALVSFTKYVPFSVVRALIRRNGVAEVGMVRDMAVVMFCDVAHFSDICAQLDDDASVSGVLSAFFDLGSSILMRHGAMIDKFIGDAIMCFWGPPGAVEHGCFRALCGGIELLRAVGSIALHNGSALSVRIGCHYGEVLVGNIGSSARINYTVLGDTVNTASRLESACARFSANFLVSDTVVKLTLASVESASVFVTRYLGRVALKGKSSRLRVHHVIGISALASDDLFSWKACKGMETGETEQAVMTQSPARCFASAALCRIPARCSEWCLRYSIVVDTYERTRGRADNFGALLQYFLDVEESLNHVESSPSISSMEDSFVPTGSLAIGLVPTSGLQDPEGVEKSLLRSMIDEVQAIIARSKKFC